MPRGKKAAKKNDEPIEEQQVQNQEPENDGLQVHEAEDPKKVKTWQEMRQEEDGKAVQVQKEILEKRLADQKRIAELEAKIKEFEQKSSSDYMPPLEMMMKDPNFGTVKRIMFCYGYKDNPKEPSKPIATMGQLSVFPNTIDTSNIDPVTKRPKLLCEDIGFMSKKVANAFREGRVKVVDGKPVIIDHVYDPKIDKDGKPFTIEHTFMEKTESGELEPVQRYATIPEIMQYERMDYYNRKKEGDKKHLEYTREMQKSI